MNQNVFDFLRKSDPTSEEIIEFAESDAARDPKVIRSAEFGRWLSQHWQVVLQAHEAKQAAKKKPPLLQLLELANEALNYQREQFDGDPETDLSVSGADLVEWFTDWRDRVHTVVRTIEGKTASSQQEAHVHDRHCFDEGYKICGIEP